MPMPCLVYSAANVTKGDQPPVEVYLEAAAKIVETVAFETAMRTSASTIEEMLGIACHLEQLAQRLRENR